MFLVIIVFDLIFVNSNKLDKEKDYLDNNIKYTKNAYNIDIPEENLESTGTITQTEVSKNSDIINNIKIIILQKCLKI